MVQGFFQSFVKMPGKPTAVWLELGQSLTNSIVKGSLTEPSVKKVFLSIHSLSKLDIKTSNCYRQFFFF